MSGAVLPLRRAREGEGTARVEAVLKATASDLLAYFRRRVRPEEDAGDLLAETMLVAWRRSADLPEDAERARMWLFGVARRVLSTHRRGQRRREALTGELREHLAVAGPADADPRAELLADLIRALPEQDREIVALVHWEGFALTEVAELLGVPAGTVRSRYSRLRTRLRAELEG